MFEYVNQNLRDSFFNCFYLFVCFFSLSDVSVTCRIFLGSVTTSTKYAETATAMNSMLTDPLSLF